VRPFKQIVLIVVVAVIIAGALADLWVDLGAGASWRHLVQETFIVLVAVAAIGYLVYDLHLQRIELARLKADLAQSKQRYAASEQLLNARQQMGRLIAAQFETWGLTASEREVALLLLKGLSFREIAEVRSTLEKTVRQQASSIYKKAGVSGRASFAAWFIEDIL
jgi:DNA-binding CsgD family transcriptional regulator